MNDARTRTVICCFRGKVGTDLSVFVGGVLIACNAGMAYMRRAVDGATAATSERSWSAV